MNTDQLLKENTELKNRIKHLNFIIDFKDVDKYVIEDIVSDPRVKETGHIFMACSTYNMGNLIPLINKWGYDKVNEHFMGLIEERGLNDE